MPHAPAQLDSRIEIVTPENIAFQYALAGPFRRLPAYAVDCLICVAVLVGSLLAFGLAFSFVGLGGIGLGIWLALAFVVSWFYFGLFETFWNGQTPGKWLFGLRVLTVEGQPINAMQAILRNVLRSLDAMPILGAAEIGIPFYMLGLAVMSANNRYQRLGDLACGTIVVVEEVNTLRGLAKVASPEVIDFAHKLPANLSVNRALSQALSIYVARRELFSAPRRLEIARTLAEPLGQRLGLPADTNPDLLLSAMYYRAFIADETPHARPTPTPPAVEVAGV